MRKFNKKTQGGFTLIELLIVVAIIGIIAAIAIPNLLNAIDRGKQKRTMADIRSIGTAVEAYAVDVNFYPRNLTFGPVPTTVAAHIEPTFIRQKKAVGESSGAYYRGTGGGIIDDSELDVPTFLRKKAD